MNWTSKEPASFFLADDKVNRRAELKKRLETVTIDGVKSTLAKLTSKASTSTEAYALFKEESSGKMWAAVIITKVDGSMMSYALLPEWENPPYYQCGRTFLKKLDQAGQSEHAAAEEWRRKCREEIERNESPTAFENLVEGTRMIWTVGADGPAHLPQGKQILLEKVLIRRRYCWQDVEGNAIYADNMIPENERQILKSKF